MADEKTEKKPKAKRNRRNFARELADVTAYCKVSLEVLGEFEAPPEHTRGRIAAFTQVLKKLGVTLS